MRGPTGSEIELYMLPAKTAGMRLNFPPGLPNEPKNYKKAINATGEIVIVPERCHGKQAIR